MMEREDWQKAEVGSKNRPTRLLPLCPGCIHNSPDCSSWVVIYLHIPLLVQSAIRSAIYVNIGTLLRRVELVSAGHHPSTTASTRSITTILKTRMNVASTCQPALHGPAQSALRQVGCQYWLDSLVPIPSSISCSSCVSCIQPRDDHAFPLPTADDQLLFFPYS